MPTRTSESHDLKWGAFKRGKFAAAEQQLRQTVRLRISGDNHSSAFNMATIAI
jgi:hypothetical protein